MPYQCLPPDNYAKRFETGAGGGKWVRFGYRGLRKLRVPQEGHIPMPQPREKLLGGHALFCCGYQDDPQYDSGGYLIVKNSQS